MDAPHATAQPTNALVTPLLTDMYQLSMAFAYWRNEKEKDHAVFELFFRKNPFKGEYTVFAGLDEVLRFVASFRCVPVARAAPRRPRRRSL